MKLLLYKFIIKAQLCVAYRCDSCAIENNTHTCGTVVYTKSQICDGKIDCPDSQAIDEDCYKPCCDGLEVTIDGKTRHFLKD